MDLSLLVDRLLPGPDGRLDAVSVASHDLVSAAVEHPAVHPVHVALHGQEWLGHPAHPIAVTVPIGAWAASAWFDARSVVTKDPRDEHAADGALRVGIAGAAAAALTGLSQYVDTRGGVRRETTVHSALNTVALGLYVASWAARKKGRRPLGRRLATLGLAVTGVSGYLGGDISYRHGVGVRPQALRSPHRPATETSDAPIEASGSHHS